MQVPTCIDCIPGRDEAGRMAKDPASSFDPPICETDTKKSQLV